MLDLLTNHDLLYVRIVPPDGAIIKSNPPSFWWTAQGFLGNGKSFKLSIWANSSADRQPDWSFTTTNCFYNVPLALPVDTHYFWRVTLMDSVKGTSNDSDVRTFFVASDATTFIVPTDVITTAKNSDHPRLLMKGDVKTAFLASSAGQSFVKQLNTVVIPYLNRRLGETLPVAPNKTASDFPPGSPEWAAYLSSVMNDFTSPQVLYISNCIYALWYNSSNAIYVNELKRRTFALLDADPAGATSNASQDQANRAILLSLAQTLDLIYNNFTVTDRNRILANIKNRTEQVYENGGVFTQLMTAPFDSHGANTLGFIASASAAMLGLIPEADAWAASIPMFLNMYSTWGEHEGGFGNGMGYNYFDVTSAPSRFNFLKWSTGVSLYQKQWVREWPLQFIYFSPPGAASGGLGFGDSGQQDMRGYQPMVCLNVVSPLLDESPTTEYQDLYNWYCNALTYKGFVDSRYNDVIWSREFNSPQPLTGNYPNAIHLAPIGWASFHSSLSDIQRTSLFFRSGRFGSYNHNYADQLCFTFAHKGKALLINSGYYDYYGSAHHYSWTKTTRSKSGGVTMDGGVGQTINQISATGNITQFGHSNEFDFVTGDALVAYNYGVTNPALQLTRAIRSVVYFRASNQFVIFDQFDANSPRGFEWNLHAFKNFTVVSPSTVKSSDGNASLCIKMLYTSSDYTFTQTDQFAVPVNLPNQAHGQFKINTNLTSVTFVVLLDPDCTGNEPQLNHNDNTWSFNIGETIGTWDGNQLAISNPETPANPSSRSPDSSVTSTASHATFWFVATIASCILLV